jgi:hypothetical protein
MQFDKCLCLGIPCILHLNSMKGSHLDVGEYIKKWTHKYYEYFIHSTFLTLFKLTPNCLLVMVSSHPKIAKHGIISCQF